jgi:gluconate 5-dehydrogenase
MSNPFDMTGKIALVTGGATGLGYHMARAMARSGADVIIAARRENVLQEAAARLNADSEVKGKVTFFPVDLGERTSIRALTAHVIDKHGGVDVFVGNAAQDFLEPIDKIKDESIDRMLQVNVSANVELARAFVPGMRRKKWGRFLFSSSALSITTSPHEGICMYTAVKGALNAFTRTLATEVGHDNITANALVLGLFYTDMVRAAEEHFRTTQGEAAARKFLEDFAGITALGRAGRLEEIEGLIQLLASDAGSYITGTNLVIDGGMSIMLRPNGIVG